MFDSVNNLFQALFDLKTKIEVLPSLLKTDEFEQDNKCGLRHYKY